MSRVTINFDDPAFFGDYIARKAKVAASDLGFSCNDLVICARNSLEASFVDEDTKKIYIGKISQYAKNHVCV